MSEWLSGKTFIYPHNENRVVWDTRQDPVGAAVYDILCRHYSEAQGWLWTGHQDGQTMSLSGQREGWRAKIGLTTSGLGAINEKG